MIVRASHDIRFHPGDRTNQPADHSNRHKSTKKNAPTRVVEVVALEPPCRRGPLELVCGEGLLPLFVVLRVLSLPPERILSLEESHPDAEALPRVGGAGGRRARGGRQTFEQSDTSGCFAFRGGGAEEMEEGGNRKKKAWLRPDPSFRKNAEFYTLSFRSVSTDIVMRERHGLRY